MSAVGQDNPCSMRWSARNKLWLLKKLMGESEQGRFSLMKEYLLSPQEADEWAHAYARHGIEGLKSRRSAQVAEAV